MELLTRQMRCLKNSQRLNRERHPMTEAWRSVVIFTDVVCVIEIDAKFARRLRASRRSFSNRPRPLRCCHMDQMIFLRRF